MCSDKYYVHMDLAQPVSNSQLQLVFVCRPSPCVCVFMQFKAF